MQGLAQSAQKMTEFTSSVMSIFIFLAMVGAVFAIFSTIRACNRGEADESQKQRSIIVGILIITLSIVVKIILVGIDDSSSSSSGPLSKWSLDFNYEEFKKYLSAYWGYGKVVIIFITLYYIGRLIYLYRLSKNSYKMFSRYNSIIEKYNAKKKPIQDHKAEIFKIDSKLINPLEPELWSKNVAYYFVEREKDNG